MCATVAPAPSSLDAMAAQVESAGRPMPATRVLGVPRQFLAQGKADDILASLGLDGAGIAESVRRVDAASPAPSPAPTDAASGRTDRRRAERGWRRSAGRSR